MILNYILAFSVLLLSVIQMTDIFHQSNRKLRETRQEFIKLTKETHRRGSLSLSAAIFTVMISALFGFYCLKFKTELNEARYRKKSYLCFHYLNIQTENYISDMTKFNWLLRSAFAVMATGIGAAQAKVVFEALKMARDGRHLYHLKNLSQNSYCPAMAFSYLNNLPYKTNALLLETNLDQTTKLRSQEWSTTYYLKPAGIRLKKSFCLKARWSAESEFLPKLQTKTEEIPAVGFSNLKCFSGFP